MKAKCLMALLLCMHCICGQAQVILRDIFGRNLSGQTITLVDWEGYIANPAIKLTVETTASNLIVYVQANGPRLYFNATSSAGASGPFKEITLNSGAPQDFYLSIFPDRAGGDEDYSLTIISGLGTQNFPIHVIDQDSDNPTIDFPILIDYSQDNPLYNFFADQSHRNVLRQAADDWAFFLQNMNFDKIGAGTQLSYIWNDLYAGGRWVANTTDYSGFLWYAYGFHTANHSNSGEASTSSFQHINNFQVPLRASGGFEAEAHGNYNTLGYDSTYKDDNWYLATNFITVKNDLYSVAEHELGHALCFYSGYPIIGNYQAKGFIDDSAIVAYQGAVVPIDGSSHLSNGQTNDYLKVVDRISKKGAFGSEFANVVPYGRWLITKLNLLILKMIGYKLKPTSAFKETTIVNTSLPNAGSGQNYAANIIADGGIPFYKFEVLSGTLPAGLDINSFNGKISGITTQAGTFNFVIRVTDYDNKYAEKSFSLNVLSVLPTSLSGFNAVNNCSSLTLTWKANEETNNKGYDIEQSIDGQNFKKIGFVAAMSGASSTYSFIYNDLIQGTSYFRLKQLDYDNHFSYSPVITLKNACAVGPYVVSPNPVLNKLHITGLPNGAHNIKLVNASGSIIAHWQKTTQHDFDISHVPGGIYILIVNEKEKFKIVKE